MRTCFRYTFTYIDYNQEFNPAIECALIFRIFIICLKCQGIYVWYSITYDEL